MASKVDTSYWRFCVWNGNIFVFVFVLFWGVLGGNFPPFQPDVPAKEVADFFRNNAAQVRIGISVSFIFAVSYAVWGIGMARVMDHIVGKDSILTTLQTWGAGLTTVVFYIALLFWMSGAFRPEALPDWDLQKLYDQAWLIVDLGYSATSVQMFALGVAAINDKRESPLIPKWLAWGGIWLGFMFLTISIMPFFRFGPFARSGLLNFWIEFGLFTLWMPVLSHFMLKAIGRIEAENANG